jgi:hypothetical protein
LYNPGLINTKTKPKGNQLRPFLGCGLHVRNILYRRDGVGEIPHSSHQKFTQDSSGYWRKKSPIKKSIGGWPI